MFRFEEHFNQDLVTLDPAIMLLKYWQSTLRKTNTIVLGLALKLSSFSLNFWPQNITNMSHLVKYFSTCYLDV